MKNLGIHIRLTIAAFVLISGATLILDIAGIHITRSFIYKRFEDRVAFLARYLALNSEVGVLIGDKAGLKSLAMNLLGEEDVVKVVIFDNQNNALVDLSRESPGPLSVVETPVVFQKTKDENMLFIPEKMTPFGAQKIPAIETIGRVRIHFSAHGIDQLMVKLTQRFIGFSLILAMVAGIVFFLLSRSVVVDLKQLVETARQVGTGSIELRARPGRLPETAELALAFNTMLDSLDQSRKALDMVNQEMIRQRSLAELGKFSLIIAHEVKNPLGIIKSSLDILKKEQKLPNDHLMVVYIEDEIRRLNRLIEEFLSFARPARPTLREVDLNDMLKSLVERFEIQYVEKPLEIRKLIPPRPFKIQADRDLLSRAVSNIIKNACEASREKGVIDIMVSCHGHQWVVDVDDQGDGIPLKDMDKIFEPFFTTRSKGTGLGLAFAAQVISAHGGTITAQNKEEGGARFRIELRGNSMPVLFPCSRGESSPDALRHQGAQK